MELGADLLPQRVSRITGRPIEPARATRLPEPPPLSRSQRRKTARLAKGTPDIVTFCESKRYLGLSLAPAQRIILKTIFGMSLDDAELPLFRQISGRSKDPVQRFESATIAAGARGGKTGYILAPALLYRARYGGHVPAKGERLRVGLFAQDGDAAGVAFDYLAGYVQNISALREALVGRPLRKRLVIQNLDG